MDARTARKLVERVQELERNQTRLRLGVVTDDTPLSVAVAGSDVPYTNVKALDGTTFVVDDLVAVLMFGRDLIVLGKVI